MTPPQEAGKEVCNQKTYSGKYKYIVAVYLFIGLTAWRASEFHKKKQLSR